MNKGKVFISFHRADNKYKNHIEAILKENSIPYYCVPDNANFDGLSHQDIADYLCKKMDDCDILLCIVGKETYTRPHVDWEIHNALKGDIGQRKGIVAVLLEKRLDNKNNLCLETFPVRLRENMDYVVLEQYASIRNTIMSAIERAKSNRNNPQIQTTHKRMPMQLRTGKYYDAN